MENLSEEELKEFREFQQWKRERQGLEAQEKDEAGLDTGESEHEGKGDDSPVQDNPSLREEEEEADPAPRHRKFRLVPFFVCVCVVFFTWLFGYYVKTTREIKDIKNGKYAMEADSLMLPDAPAAAPAFPPHKPDAAMKAENERTIKSLKPKMRIKADEIETNRKWVKPKTATSYIDVNDIYCYFCIVDGVAQNFRLRIQYAADDWLFISRYRFNIDGFVFDYAPYDIKRDNNSRIWEWSDENISPSDRALLDALTAAKSAKIQFIGSNYSKTRTITKKQLKAIREVYEYYCALGGRI